MRARRPNIVCFITDDTGFDMLGYSGGPVLTPHIDSIAAGGVTAGRFHTAAPACCPSRYSYLTGLYPGHCTARRFRGLHPTDKPYNVDFNVDVLGDATSYGHVFQQAGYATGYTGKWHTGEPRGQFHGHRFDLDDDPSEPAVAAKLREDYDAMRQAVREAGFDYAEAIAWGNTDNRPLKALQYHNIEWHTDAALKFLDRYAGKQPFFLTMATTTIHGPHHVESLQTDGRVCEYGYLDEAPQVQAPRASIFERLEAAGLEVNHRSAGAMWQDDAFGAVMARVAELGLAEDTIFIFSTDHGVGTTGGKFTLYQGGLHIPFCMRWDGQIPAGSTCEALLQNVDLLPTLAEAAGIECPANLDGMSRWAQLTGAAGDDREDLYFEWGYTRSVRTDRWKYIAWRHTPEQLEKMRRGEVSMAYNMHNRPKGEFAMHLYPHYFDVDQLFDLQADPDEQHNLAADPACAEVLTDMRRRLRAHLDRFEHPFGLDQCDPFVVSPEYAELARASRADQSLYEPEWYRVRAY